MVKNLAVIALLTGWNCTGFGIAGIVKAGIIREPGYRAETGLRYLFFKRLSGGNIQNVKGTQFSAAF